MKNVRNISSKTFLSELLDAPYMRVWGVVVSAAPKESKYGECLLFRGHFEAVSLETGDMVSSTKLYLPGPIEADLNEKRVLAGGSVEFSYEIERTEDPDIAVGYFYTWTDLTSENDLDVESVMSKLRSTFNPS